MFEKDQFELIDFGDGKKLESFAGIQVLRDCPAANSIPPASNWNSLQTGSNCICFHKSRSQWKPDDSYPEKWQIAHRQVLFNLKPTPFGHLGVFCEQAGNWDWILDLPIHTDGAKGLNLFAYTGGSTLALAQKNISVVHLDAARNVVNWARKNAEISGMSSAPIRWIVEDAMKFVNREIKRGNKYDFIVADPPAIGHSGNKMTWKFGRDIDELMRSLSQIASENFLGLLLSCHTEGYDSAHLAALGNENFDLESGVSESGTMDLESRDGRRLNCGHYFRWCRQT